MASICKLVSLNAKNNSAFGILKKGIPKQSIPLFRSQRRSTSIFDIQKQDVKIRCFSNDPKDKPEDYASNRIEVRNHSVQDFENRMGKGSLYSNQIKPTTTLAQLHSSYSHLQPTEQLTDKIFTIVGRIQSKRESSKKLLFYTIENDGTTIQIMANSKNFVGEPNDFSFMHQHLKRGDIIGVKGWIGRTKAGELSLYPTEYHLLVPCNHNLPDRYGLKDPEVRFSRRYLDLMVNTTHKEIFIKRAKAISFLRKFLDERGFIEVETPILGHSAGGANAIPFSTHAKALDHDMFLRIAPELYLKQLVIGGINKVYEIGKSFRNEGIDFNHNPEFTTCEFYEAYSDYQSLMKTTEELLFDIFNKLHIVFYFL